MRQVAHISEVDYPSFYSILSCLTPPLLYISFLNLPVPIVLPFWWKEALWELKVLFSRTIIPLAKSWKRNFQSGVLCFVCKGFSSPHPTHPPPFPSLKPYVRIIFPSPWNKSPQNEEFPYSRTLVLQLIIQWLIIVVEL